MNRSGTGAIEGRRPNRRSPSITAFLSFLLPGLGHWYLGRRRVAVAFALPVLAVVAVLGIQALMSLDGLVVYLITPTGALTVLVLVVLLGIWRILAMADATAAAARRRGGTSLSTKGAVTILVALIVGTHLYGAQVSYALYQASSQIFVGGGPDDRTESPQGSGAGADDPASDYVAQPVEPSSDARINILLTGIDSADSRSHALTDTLLVVSVNPADGSLAMLSFPRDISQFPLWNGGTYAGKINSLMSWARSHPREFPEGPFPALVNEIGFLLGSPINYYAAVDMAGLKLLVDEVGGVTLVNPRAIDDPKYDWLDGTHGFKLAAGTVRLDGRLALAYVRSRQGAGDNDYTRAARQQQLLLALRDRLMSPEMLPRVPALAKIVGGIVKTNLPPDRLEDMMGIARTVDTTSTERIVLGPPYAYHPPSNTTGGSWTLRLHMDKLAALSIRLFGDQSRYAGN